MARRTKTRTWQNAVLPNRSRAAHRNKTAFVSDGADFNRTLRNRGIRRHRRTITRRGNTYLWSTKGGVAIRKQNIQKDIHPIVNIGDEREPRVHLQMHVVYTYIEIMRGKSQD